MPISNDARRSFDRFDSILSQTKCVRPIYDEILFEIDDCVVTPTLGSILPYWLLVIPRRASHNFDQWRRDQGIEPGVVVKNVLHRCSVSTKRAFWFEHGAVTPNSLISCGVDHAHLHIVVDAPFSFHEFIVAVRSAAPISWQTGEVERLYPNLAGDKSYFVAANFDTGLLAEGVEVFGSQFFRRVIAGLVGNPESWNYQTHAFADNARKTVLAFAR